MARATWTQKTYEMVAEVLRENWTPPDLSEAESERIPKGSEGDRTTRLAAESFAGHFKADNPSFDRERFYTAIFGDERS